MGVGWALAAFQRLGSLSAARAAALGAGLILLVPYGIGTITGAGVPAGFAAWTPTSQLVGMLPALLARAVHRTVGTAGGVLVGVFALSALGILTVGGHPLTVLISPARGDGKRVSEKPTQPLPADKPTPPVATSLPFPVSRFPAERHVTGAPVA